MAGSQRTLKHLNRIALLRHVKSRPGLVRGELANLVGLADSTVSVLVNELVHEGWLRATGSGPTSGPGRRPARLELDPSRISLLGAEVGNDYLNVVACGLDGQLHHARMIDFNHADLARSIGALAELIGEARRAALGAGRRVLGAGVGLPGMVGFDGQLRLAPGIGWRDVPFGRLLSEALQGQGCADLPVSVLNDANAAALSEYVFGAPPALGSLVFLSLGYGVGAGIVLDDRLLLGHDGLAGEVGHTVIKPGGPLCACGRRGCAETVLSQRVISRLATGKASPVLRVAELAARLEGGEEALKRVVRGAGTHLGMVLQRLVVVINPEVLILGGPLSRLPGLVDEAVATLDRLGGERPYHRAEVRICRFGLDAGAVGAAASVLHHTLNPPATSRPAVTLP